MKLLCVPTPGALGMPGHQQPPVPSGSQTSPHLPPSRRPKAARASDLCMQGPQATAAQTSLVCSWNGRLDAFVQETVTGHSAGVTQHTCLWTQSWAGGPRAAEAERPVKQGRKGMNSQSPARLAAKARPASEEKQSVTKQKGVLPSPDWRSLLWCGAIWLSRRTSRRQVWSMAGGGPRMRGQARWPWGRRGHGTSRGSEDGVPSSFVIL